MDAPSRTESGKSPPICDYEQSTYRGDFWEGQGREYEDLVERRALRRLLPRRGRRLVDVGAGFGRLAPLYESFDQVVLLDYSSSQLEYARGQLGPRHVYVAADIYHLPLASNSVDTAVMVRVLHHIADVPAALAQIRRILCSQGVFVLEFANKRHLKNIARYLMGRGINPFEREPYEFAELHYDFHPSWVQDQLSDLGLGVERRLSVSLFRLQLLKRLLPLRVLVAMDGLLQSISAPLTPAPSVFLRSRIQKQGEGDAVDAGCLFRCPRCGHEPLVSIDEGLVCPACEAVWPMRNGVYILK